MERTQKNGTIFGFKEAKENIDLKDYLAKLGFKHTKHPTTNEYWYHSPFNPEWDSTPSFKIDAVNGKQVWYDHSLGFGGDLVDFGTRFHHCTHRELLQKFKDFLSFHPQQTIKAEKHFHKNPEKGNAIEAERKIGIVAERPIFKFYLKNYLRERCIPLDLANQYLKEIDFTNNSKGRNDKVYTALGFKNNEGGYELRSKNFKGSSAPKAPTFIQNNFEEPAISNPQNAQSLAVFEGFFSFLSFQVLHFHNKLDVSLPDNYLVLNSLSFFRKSLELMDTYGEKMLFLDNDRSGQSAMKQALERGNNYSDYSPLYQNEKDLNAFLIASFQQNKEQENGHRIKR